MNSEFEWLDSETSFRRSFAWDASSSRSAFLGGLHRDMWAVVSQHLHEKDLASFLFAHPFWYDLARKDGRLRERVAVNGRSFDGQLTHEGVQLSHDKKRAKCVLSLGNSECTNTNTNTAVVRFASPVTKPGQAREVHFRLLSDFRTPTYVSYFNFSLVEPVGTESYGVFHFFRDGDVWGQPYNGMYRPAANWEENDILSFRIWISAKEDFPESSSCSNHREPLKHEPAETRSCVAILSDADHDVGCRIFCQFYRNGFRVHLPIRTHNEKCLRFVMHFCELKDHIEIVNPIRLSEEFYKK